MLIFVALLGALLLGLGFKAYRFHIFRSKLLHSLGQEGLNYQQADSIYTEYNKMIHDMYIDGDSPEEIGKKVALILRISIAEEAISLAIVNLFRSIFYLTDYFDTNKDEIIFPKNLLTDPYILGYISGLKNMLLKYEFRLDSLTTSLKGILNKHIMLSVFNSQYSDDILVSMTDFKDSSYQENEFKRGLHDSILCYVAMIGKLNEDYDDPLINEARSMSSLSVIDPSDIQEKDTLDADERLGSNIRKLTFYRYIDRKYLNGKYADIF